MANLSILLFLSLIFLGCEELPFAENGSSSAASQDSKPPTLANPTLTVSYDNVSSVAVTYSAASDNMTSEAELTYQLHYTLTESPAQPTLSELESDWTPTGQVLQGVLSLTLNNLESNAIYHFTVLAMDESGNGAIYDVASLDTAHSKEETDSEDFTPKLSRPAKTLLGSNSSTTIDISFPDQEVGDILFTDKLKDNDKALLFTVVSGDPACTATLTSWDDSENALAKFTISSCTGDGTFYPYATEGIAGDVDGNTSGKSGKGDTLTIDTTAPEITWSPANATLSSAATTYIATFSEKVSKINVDSILITGTCDSIPVAESATMNESNTQATFTIGSATCTDSQTLSVSMTAADIVDLAGNAAGTAPTTTTTIDTTSPSAAIGTPSKTKANSTDTISIDFTFSGASQTKNTLTASGGGITITQVSGSTACTVAVKNKSATGGTIELTSCTGDGNITVHVDAATAADAAGNSSTQSGESSQIKIDNTLPTLSSSDPADAATFSTVPTSIDLTFSEAVNVESSDFSFGGTCTSPSISSISGDGTADVTLSLSGGSCTDSQTIILTIDLTQITDLSGNTGASSTSATFTSSSPKKIFLTHNKFDGLITDIYNNAGTDTGSDNVGATGIARADYACNSVSDSRRPSGGGTYKALIVDGVNRRACSTASCSGGSSEHIDWVLQANKSYIRGSDGNTPIGTTNSNGLFSFDLTNAFIGTGEQSGPNFWSGINGDWTEGANNCNGWSINGNIASSGYSGHRGQAYQVSTTAVAHSTSATCSAEWYLICVEQ